jgi:hypothetical protein
MKLISEQVEDVKYIVEAKEDGKKNVFIEGIFLQANMKNRNGRVYPTEVLAKEVKRYTEEYINQSRAFGELGHPEGPTINLDRVSHMVTALRQDGDNFIGKAKITDTPMGRIVKEIIAEGGRLGVSSRGMGSLKQSGGASVVQSDFYLATAADIVADPSAPQAFVNGIMEGKEWVWDNGLLKERTIEDTRKQIEEAARKKTLNEAEQLRIFSDFLRKVGNV